jgi:hypothetical protein
LSAKPVRKVTTAFAESTNTVQQKSNQVENILPIAREERDLRKKENQKVEVIA